MPSMALQSLSTCSADQAFALLGSVDTILTRKGVPSKYY